MDTLEKPELASSICHIARFLESGIPIHNSKVVDTAGRKTRRRRGRTQAIAKHFVFHAITTNCKTLLVQEIIH